MSNLNAPSATQSTSTSAVTNQDHMDVVALGPDTVYEPEFYAAIIGYIVAFD